MRKVFRFHSKFLKEIESLPREHQLEAYNMVVHYGLEGKGPGMFTDNVLKETWERIYDVFKKDERKAERESSGMFATPEEEQFVSFMENAYPSLARFDCPLTYWQYQELKKEYPKEAVDDKIAYLDNMRNASKKYTSVYSTIRLWLKKDNRSAE